MELRKIFFTLSKKIENIAVFLTRVGIRQMPFDFFLPLQEFKTIRIKPEKNSFTQANSVYYIYQGISKIFSNIFALLLIFRKL